VRRTARDRERAGENVDETRTISLDATTASTKVASRRTGTRVAHRRPREGKHSRVRRRKSRRGREPFLPFLVAPRIAIGRGRARPLAARASDIRLIWKRGAGRYGCGVVESVTRTATRRGACRLTRDGRVIGRVRGLQRQRPGPPRRRLGSRRVRPCRIPRRAWLSAWPCGPGLSASPRAALKAPPTCVDCAQLSETALRYSRSPTATAFR